MPDGRSPLDMGAPWASLSGLAGAQDPQAAKNIGAEIDPVLKQQLDRLSWIAASGKVANEAAAVPSPPDEISMKTDPKTGQRTVNVKTSAENYENTTRSAMNWHTALGGMQQELQSMDAKLKAQEQQARNQPPWIQLATALSANLASQKDMPGWVRGLGQTAAQLNPRPEEIQARRLGIMGEEAKLAEAGARMGESSMRTGIETQRLGIETAREERLTKDEARKAEEDRVRDVRSTRDKLLLAAGKGEAPSPDVVNQLFLEKKMDPKEAAILADAVNKTNVAAQAKITADRVLTERRVSALERGVTAKTSEKSDADKAIEAVAQSIAKGDLSSIRDITTFRSQERSKIYARALEINPKFSVSETQRKIDTMKAFTTGKEGDALKSFDTFLQHAGELDDTLNALYQSRSPALNKPMNWIRKNAEGNPEYQRLLVAIEPVGKEFESFLLNNRALYLEDRRQIAELMNGNSSPAQIKAALTQMGKTAKDRFTAMNQKFKRVVGQDIPDPFSNEALASAAKIGIDLPQGKPSPGAAGGGDDLDKKLKALGLVP